MTKTAEKKRLVWNFNSPDKLLEWENVHTVCAESGCPNRLECSRSKTATFLIGGKYCTRNCGFCLVEHGKPVPVSMLAAAEEKEVISASLSLGLKYVVITSVTRDDDPEGLARHFASLCAALKSRGFGVELLIPDFSGSEALLKIIGDAGPDVIAHNLETVQRLTPMVRNRASYEKSLKVLQYYHEQYPKILVKTGIMTGLGESREEIQETISDAFQAGTDMLTIGQYLQPGKDQIPVARYYSREEFLDLERVARETGIRQVVSGYYIRSSYRARELHDSMR